MSMFCFQCQETAKGTGCDVRGVCGKTEEVAKLQDLLIYTLKGLSQLIVKGKIESVNLPKQNHALLKSLFMTITNANFDERALENQIREVAKLRDDLAAKLSLSNLHDAATFSVGTKEEMLEKAENIGVLSTENEDIRSLRELITYGLKGMAAYTHHAYNLKKENTEIYSFMYHALSAMLDQSLSTKDLFKLTLETGRFGVSAMALLDDANTSKYGNPVITKVDIGARDNPAILISGHDLTDLEQLLEQTRNSGVDVYTHCEMLPAHSYPFFKKYPHLVGNYGNAWWKQAEEFVSFGGPILFTTNCIVPPRSEEIRRRIFTTGAAGFPGCQHIEMDEYWKKDFSEIIAMAKTLPSPIPIEGGELTCGFAHEQMFALADKVSEAIRMGTIKQFVVMAGCDGRMKAREYYTEFAKALPADTVVLTAGCAKYRYNKIGLGMIGDMPRVIDAGQCNDSYSLV
ncbi:MAG: hydroxylamine reductase, partial [Eubacteriales bacterium]|nr:hydroxylamine reductase [Eubacteriales bacterium]